MDDMKLREELIRDEGLVLLSYKDTNGFWTVGVGHLLGSTPRILSLTRAEAMAFLALDIAIAEQSVKDVFFTKSGLTAPSWVLVDDVRQRALINMMFNRGEQHVRDSTTITPAIKAALQAEVYNGFGLKPWEAVSDAILASPWAKQIGQRAVRLAQMFKTGETP